MQTRRWQPLVVPAPNQSRRWLPEQVLSSAQTNTTLYFLPAGRFTFVSMHYGTLDHMLEQHLHSLPYIAGRFSSRCPPQCDRLTLLPINYLPPKSQPFNPLSFPSPPAWPLCMRPLNSHACRTCYTRAHFQIPQDFFGRHTFRRR